MYLKTFFSALLNESFEREFVLGKKNIRPPNLIELLRSNLRKEYVFNSKAEASRNLDHYIEAQIHGPINLDRDVAILVADSSFKNTYIENEIHDLCGKYQIQFEWTKGFEITASEIPIDFRGASMPSLANKIAVKNKANAYVLGLAAKDLKLHPEKWTEIGTYEHCLQELKLLWHVLVKYGN